MITRSESRGVVPVDTSWTDFLRWLADVAGPSYLAQYRGHTRRAYARHVANFTVWLYQHVDQRLDRQVIGVYRDELIDAHLSASAVNQALASIRGLVREAAERNCAPDCVSLVGGD